MGKSPKYPHSFSEYGRRYNRSVPTISRYAAEGLPLDDPVAMTRILAEKEAHRGRAGVPPASRSDQLGDTGDDDAPGEANDGKRTIFTIQNEIKEEDLLIKRAKRLVMEGKWIERETVRQAGLKIGSELDNELKRMAVDIPATCAGLTSVQLQTKLDAMLITVRKNVKKALAATTAIEFTQA